jgi:hypothetical protein
MLSDDPVVTVKISFDDFELPPELVMCFYGVYALCITSIIYMYYALLDNLVSKVLQYKNGNSVEYTRLRNNE